MSLGLSLTPHSVSAQPTFEQFVVSTDTSARVPFVEGPGNVITNDRSQIFVQPDGRGSAFAFAPISTLFGADVDALHRIPTRYSIDTARIINGVLIRPGDVFFVFSDNPPTVFFDAEAASVPDNVNLDAFTIDQDSGLALVSFDRYFEIPALGFVAPGDLIQVNSEGQLEQLAFDSAILPDGVNLDAVHWVSTEFLLLSFDVTTTLPAQGGTITVSDDTIVLYSTVSERFERIISLNVDSSSSWDGGDVDALWAELEVNAGAFRFTTAFREVAEDVGTFELTVQRIDGSETAVEARVTSESDTADAGSDFVAIDQLLSWADGDSSTRTVNITINNDALEEDNPERFSVRLTVESGEAELASPSQVQINILDNDGQNLFSDGFES